MGGFITMMFLRKFFRFSSIVVVSFIVLVSQISKALSFAHKLHHHRQLHNVDIDSINRASPGVISALPSHNSGGIPFVQHFKLDQQRHIHKRLSTGYHDISNQKYCSSNDDVPASSGGTVSHTFRPVDYGADPTGVNDSYSAFEALMKDMFVGESQWMQKFVDLGGATIDLDGGAYSLSAPLVLPSPFQNYGMHGGHIYAGNGFPKGKTLVTFGNISQAKGQYY